MRRFLLVSALAGLLAAATAVSTVNSHAAHVAAPQTVRVRDATGDASGNGKTQPGRRYVDIRSVTVSRLEERKLRVVVETVAPLRVESYVTFRYVDPSGLNKEASLFALVGRGAVWSLTRKMGRPWVYAGLGAVEGKGERRRDGVSISRKRITLNLDLGVRNVYFLKYYPRFRWMVTVARDDGMSDSVPDQGKAGIDRFASFP